MEKKYLGSIKVVSLSLFLCFAQILEAETFFKRYGASNYVENTSDESTLEGSSDVSTTGITDQFESEEQFSETTGGVNGTTCIATDEAAQVGAFWFEDKDPDTDFSAEITRLGNGELSYVLSQEEAQYNAIGFNFGEYCVDGVKEKHVLDLTNDATLKVTIESPATNVTEFDIKIQMKDADGNVLAINKTVLNTDGSVDEDFWYLHEIGYSKHHLAEDYNELVPGTTSDFIFDFKDALSIDNPDDPSFPEDINIDNNSFDFSKVTEVIIIPINSEDSGAPVYGPLAYENQTLIFSNLTIGDPTLGENFCTIPSIPTTEDVSYCQNVTDVMMLSATGTNGLVQKWYTSFTGGTASDIAPTPSSVVAGVTNYYVSEATSFTSTCEGNRAVISVEIIESPIALAALAIDEVVEGPNVDVVGEGSEIGTWEFVSGPSTSVTFSPSENAEEVTVQGLNIVGDYILKYTVSNDSDCSDAIANLEFTVNSITAISSLEEGNISAYPNPVDDELMVSIADVITVESIKVLDVVGRVIYSTDTVSEINKISTDKWGAGIYILEISKANEKFVSTIRK